MTKATVTFEVDVIVEVPDDYCERARQMQRDLGESYLSKDATDENILTRLAFIRGMRGYRQDESVDEAMNAEVRISVNDEDSVINYEELP